MAGLITELLSLLADESSLYERLIGSALSKKEVIVKNDIASLKMINVEENSLIGKLQKLERRRSVLIRDIAQVLNEKESGITITYLASAVSDRNDAEALGGAAVKLDAQLSRLKEVNELNRALIENSIDYINFSVNVIRSSADDSPYYCSPTGDDVSEGTSFLNIMH